MSTPPVLPAAAPMAPLAAVIAPFDTNHPGWTALASLMQTLDGQLVASPQGPEFVPSTTVGLPVPVRIDTGVCPLPDYGLLTVLGADAGTFLQSQLTNDLLSMTADEARWTGYCTPKGRLLTTALNWSLSDGFALAVARTQAETLRKRLAMYVLRAKAKVIDASPNWLAFGLIGDAIAPALAAFGLSVPTAPMSITRVPQSEHGPIAMSLPTISRSLDAGDALPRAMLWLPLTDAQGQPSDAALAALQAQVGSLQATALWRWTEVRAAIPRLFPGSAELFVPQMVNFEAIGGVNFKKGCYPGQEIVARSQYLGKLKRRMFAGHIAVNASEASAANFALPAPGQDILPASGAEPCGQVVLSAPNPAGGIDLLFESQIHAADQGVQVGGYAIERLPLPYDITR